MILAAAQMQSIVGDINANLMEHERLIKLATKHRAALIVFPEMSITGYTREKGKELAFSEDDSPIK